MRILFFIFIGLFCTQKTLGADPIATALQNAVEFVAGDPCYKKNQQDQSVQDANCPVQKVAPALSAYQKLQSTQENLFFNEAAQEYITRNKCWANKIQTMTPEQKTSLNQQIKNLMPMIMDLDNQIKALRLARAHYVQGEQQSSGSSPDDIKRNKRINDVIKKFNDQEDALRKKLDEVLSSTSLGDHFLAKARILSLAQKFESNPAKFDQFTNQDLDGQILKPILDKSEKEQVDILNTTSEGQNIYNYYTPTNETYAGEEFGDTATIYSKMKTLDPTKLSFNLNDDQKVKLFKDNQLGDYLLNKSSADTKANANLYCQLDDKYGVRRETYDKVANGLEFVSTLAIPLGPYALAGRALIAVDTAKIMSNGISMGFTALNTYANLQKECGPSSVNFRVSPTCDSSQIPMDSFVKEVSHKNCFLSVGLSAASFATPAGQAAYLKLKKSLGLPEQAATEAIVSTDSGINRGVAALPGAGAAATITDITTAKKVSESAWLKTEQFLKSKGVNTQFTTPDQETQIKKIYDRFLCREVTPPPALGCIFSTTGLRVIDAPQLDASKVLPDYIKKYLTVDHHEVFGKELASDVNSGVQILDMLDPSNKVKYVDPKKFNQMFHYVASDNIADAFGLSTWIVRNADKIRGNPEMIAKLKALTRAEDFDLFGPAMNLSKDNQLAAMLNIYDQTIPKVQNTFMDRVNHTLTDNSVVELGKMQNSLDRILTPKTEADQKFLTDLANQYRSRIDQATSIAQQSRVPLTANDKRIPIYFADTTNLRSNTKGVFEGSAAVPQYVQKFEAENPSSQKLNSSFQIFGSKDSPTRTLILGNFPGRGLPMNSVLPGQTQSFEKALLVTERGAIARSIASGKLDATQLAVAQQRLNDIDAGKNVFGSYPNGTLIFGPTYMTSDELKLSIEANAKLLGY